VPGISNGDYENIGAGFMLGIIGVPALMFIASMLSAARDNPKSVGDWLIRVGQLFFKRD
jgi:hypothetical protein